MKKILVAGSTNMDFVAQVHHIPAVGETILSSSFARIPGGKGANQACACGRLGGNTVFLSAVGKDGLGSVAIENLLAAGVDCSKVRFRDDLSTGLALISVNQEGDNSIIVIPGANRACDTDYLREQEALIREADIVMAQMEIPHEAVYWLMKTAHDAGKVTILNPAPAPDSIPEDIYPALTYMTPNETELKKLTGCETDDPEQIARAAEQLIAAGVGNVIVTLGSRGALLKNREKEALFPPPPAKAVDTTAAGDTFNGALAVMLAEGAPVEKAIRFANAAASITVSRKGAQISVPDRAEAEQKMKEFNNKLG